MTQILGIILAGMMVLSGCVIPSEKIQTPTVEATPSPTLTPIPTPTAEATATPEPTATAEVVVEEKPNIYMDEKIEYRGRQFDFQISMLPSDTIVKEVFDKYEIKSLAINENKTDARELLAKAIIYTFLKTYNFQNKTNVGLQEYMANPEKYPAMIMMRDADKKLTEQAVTIDQIKTFEMRYTNGAGGQLYMGMPGQSNVGSGYSFDGEKFTFYTGIPQNLYSVDENVAAGFGKELEVYPFLVGYEAVEINFRNTLGLMPYTIFRIVDQKGWDDLDGRGIFPYFDEMTDTQEPRLPVDQLILWTVSHRLFTVALK